MDYILSLALTSIQQVGLALQHNWPYLLVSVLIAVLLKLYVKTETISGFLNRYRGAGVVAATAAAVTTPLCSCGTTAVILGMMATTMPWAPIIAFMIASPLSSPEGLVYSAGLFGWPFALAYYLASILLGLGGGWLATILEKRGWLANQNRFAPAAAASLTSGAATVKAPGRVYGLDVPAVTLRETSSCCGQGAPAEPVSSCGCGQPAAVAPVSSCACSAPVPEAPVTSFACGTNSTTASNNSQTIHATAQTKSAVTFTMFAKELYENGKRLLFMFAGFAFIGYFLNSLIPPGWVPALFGSGHFYSVPLAATLGLPFYINSETSLPLVLAMLDSGMSQGAALTFLIAGSGTSIGAITGALTIARWRVVGLIVAVLWIGAIFSGYAFDLVLSMNLF